ncbi:MAG: isoleucine--tRNA ligase [Thermoanaerobaculia bacterium]
MTEPKDYKATLNLPRTDFPMKADLPRREPARLEAWEKLNLEARRRAAARGRPLYILHDGPPYANGNIHLGHVMNKTLKDFVARSRAMMGFDAPYVPGWDCHGLPIEQKVDKKLGSKKREMDAPAIRKACREYAQGFIDIQREEFKRLGIGGLWDRPYSTMSVSYEAATAWTFGEFYKKGLVFQDLKSVRWCSTDQTALAEAELEYEEREDPAIYVRFPTTDRVKLDAAFSLGDRPPHLKDADVDLLAWTTTPWTIPSNVAIAVHPEEIYILATDENNRAFLLAEKLSASVAAATGLKLRTLGKVPGSALVGLRYRHPLPPDQRGALKPEEAAASFRIVAGAYVTMDTGTGLVHTAPGHGEDDFQTGRREGLPILSPVGEAGRFTEKVVKYQGKKVLDANPEIVEDLRAAGALLHEDKSFRHEYPHCWRCKRPVIFRATVQWFIRLDDEQVNVRKRALEAIRTVSWAPAWGEQRIAGMVENRREWLISRQRRWGSPITLLYPVRDGKRGEPYPWRDDPKEQIKFFEHVVSIFRKEGGDAWYARPAQDFLPPGADRRGFSEFAKETDILDVWFDSGVSHQAVLRSGQWPELARPEGAVPADIYVEGHDQHRGWFQSSLLTSVTIYGQAPYSTVLTHGFFFDASGRKMSKSLGNVIEPQQMMKTYGADILRFWVCSIDYRDDGPISEEIVGRCADAYRKIRNTARYLISNLYDFDPERDALPFAQLAPLDRRALCETRRAAERILAAYERFEFHAVYHTLVNLCGTTLSAFYLDILKDRLYASAPASRQRRAAQTALHRIARAVATLSAPVLPFTSEEIWEALPGRKEESVHLARFETLNDIPAGADTDPAWDRLTRLREDVAAVLEEARREKTIGSSLEASIALTASDELERDRAAVEGAGAGLADLFIVSEVRQAPAGSQGRSSQAYPGLTIRFEKAAGARCDRCWKVTPEAVETGLCARCRAVLATLRKAEGAA